MGGSLKKIKGLFASKLGIGLLENSPNARATLFSGGDEPISQPCKAKSYHGFLGIEKQVVDYIFEFIKNN